MQGTILDFLNLAVENEALAKELLELAAKYDFAFTDELNDEQLDDVAGGVVLSSTPQEVAEAPQQLPSSDTSDVNQMKSNMAARAHQTMMSIIGNLRA